MKYLCFIVLLCFGFSISAQSVLNNYKYVIVPKKFEGFRSENLYQTSTLVKYYLTKHGFNAVYDDALPQDLNTDRCLGLVSSLEEDSSIFATRVSVVFRDCQLKEVYRTPLGSSKTKQYKEAYRESISAAFKTMGGFQFAYAPKGGNRATTTLNFKDDVKQLDPPKEEIVEMEVPDTETPMDPELDKEREVSTSAPEEISEAVTLEEAVSVDAIPEPPTMDKTLYAQRTETGYQLIDLTPSIQFYIQETSIPEMYIAEGNGRHGILFKRDEQWIFEYYNGDDRFQEILQIKF